MTTFTGKTVSDMRKRGLEIKGALVEPASLFYHNHCRSPDAGFRRRRVAPVTYPYIWASRVD